MELIRDEGDITSNELMQEVWQQFVCYKEKSSKRFQELEEMIDEAVQKMKLIQRIRKQKVEKFLSPSGWEVQKKQNRKVLSQETSQNSPHYKLITPRFDEWLGEDKVDWRSEEIICIALGPKDFFQPKKNSEQGNSYGAKELECTYDFRITPRKIKSNGKEELYEPIYDEEPVYDKEESEVISAFSTGKIVDSLPQVELRQGGEVFDLLQECENQLCPEPIYDEDPREGMEYLYAQPIYDEDPREGMECWPEHEFILAALGGSNLHSSIFLPSEFGTSEGLEEQDIQESQHKSVPPENSNRHAGNNSNEKFELKGHFSFVDEKDIYNNLGILPKIRMSARKSVYDLQPVPIIDKVPYLELNALTTSLNHLSGELNWTEIGSICAANICGLQLRSLRTASSYDLGGLASGNHVFIFDPGGYGSNGQQTYVVDMFMDLIKIKEGMLDEAAIIDSTGGRLGQLQLQKGIRTQGQDTLGLQEETDRVISVIIQQYAQSVRAGLTVIPRYLVRKYDLPEMDWVVRLEDHMASRTSATTYVFDPGGCPGGVYGLDLLIVLLEFYMSSICCQRFQGQKLAISENQPKESCRRCRRHRKRLCLVIHEDMNPLMGEGMSGIACSIACNGSSSNSKGTTVIASVFVFELV